MKIFEILWKHFYEKILVERTNATSSFVNQKQYLGKNLLQLRKIDLVSVTLCTYWNILNTKSVHEGHSELSNLGIILKGKCEP